MTVSLPSLRGRSVLVKVLLVVLLAGVLVLTMATAVTIALVVDDKQASLSETAILQAGGMSQELDRRIERARSDLAAAALASEAGRPFEARELLGNDLSAVRVERGEEVLLEAAENAEASTRIADATLTEDVVVLLSHTEVLVRSDVGRLKAVGILDARSVLQAAPPGWEIELIPRESGTLAGIAARRADRDDESFVRVTAPGTHGLVVVALAPLAPARDAAYGIVRQVLLWSWLTVLPLFLLAFLFARRVTAPIRALARAVDEASSGPVVLPALPTDEIGELGLAISAMSDRVHSDADALRRTIRFARRIGSATERRVIYERLRAVLEETVTEVRWAVVPAEQIDSGDVDEVSTGVSLSRLRQRLGVRSEPPSLPPSQKSGRRRRRVRKTLEMPGLVPVDEDIFLIALRTERTAFAVVVGRTAAVAPPLRLAQLLCRVALAALRNLELAEEAVAAEKLSALGRLAASVAHEVNNPLSYVLANLKVLERELEGDQLEMAKDAMGGAERVSSIVSDLSLLARGGRQMATADEDLVAISEGAVQTIRRKAPGVTIHLTGADRLILSCNAGRLDQALVNLIGNAADACSMSREPRVDVSMRRQQGRAFVRIEDNGRGIPESMKKRLFEPFITGKGDAGTGLGLYLAQTFARSHGGDIELVATGPRGTVFELWMPIKTAPPSALPLPGAAPRARARFLIIDDDRAVLRAAKRWLGLRADVAVVSDPREAITHLERDQPDLILCDLAIGAVDGRELAEEIVARWPVLGGRIVFLSGNAAEDDVIQKPLQDADVKALIAQALTHAEHRTAGVLERAG